MDVNKFTDSVKMALQQAFTLAAEYQHQKVDGEHLLLTLLEQEGSFAARILTKLDVDAQALRQQLQELLNKRPKVSDISEQYISTDLAALLNSAQKKASKNGDDYASVEHILNAIMDKGKKTDCARLLSEAGVNRKNLNEVKNIGTNGFCVLGAVNNTADPRRVIKRLQEKWKTTTF